MKTSIDVVWWLTYQKCVFKGHVESLDWSNQENFLKLIKLLALYNDWINSIVLKKCSIECKIYISTSQKEILRVLAMNIEIVIREEVENSKFYIIVNESIDVF